ncbi:MAG TPA: S8 family serine peptidase [Vicinamibacteria bacterium]|nr:S8 family serine peptidase [Vicinamibacteria bacterium]
MKRLLLLLAVAAWILPTVVSVRASSVFRTATRDRRPMPAYWPGQAIVKFQTATSQGVTERAISEAGGLRARRSPYGGHYVVDLAPDVTVDSALSHFRSLREVEYAEPNGVVRKALRPNDRFFEFQWHMRQVGAERTWDIQRGRADVAVAVIDTGIAYEDFGPFRRAPDWGNRSFLQGFDFVNGDTHANDDDAHGTHVASTIGEATDNGVGVTGLAFDCALMPVKVLDEEGFGSFADVADGVDYAINFTQNGGRPVKVINLSLGGPSASETLRRALDRAEAAGVVVVAAAGNDGERRIDYPAAFPSVMAVGALDARKQRAPYSNFGAELDVMAPGGNLDRDDNGDGDVDGVLQQTFDPGLADIGIFDDFAFWYFEGTSQATPHVAALAALLVTQGITNPAAVRAAIEQTAEDLGTAGRDDDYGHGLIRPEQALKGLGLNQ